MNTTEPGLGSAIEASRARRRQATAQRTAQREARWKANRYSVPYRTDGPKVSLGVLWFVALVFFLVKAPVLAALLVSAVAAIAGLQVGHAWAHVALTDRRLCAGMAGLVALGSVAGALGLGIALIVVSLGALGYAGIGVDFGHGRADAGATSDRVIAFAELAIRSSIPAALAGGSIVALGYHEPMAAVALVAMVSAYEAGDFLVGTGSANAVEGPVAGLTALAVVAFAVYLVQPDPLDASGVIVFALLTAVACPLGQLAGSAILPRGDAWAPALRRLDSYLIAAPLWLLLI